MNVKLARQGLKLFRNSLAPRGVRHANVRRWVAATQYLAARNIHAIAPNTAFVYRPGKMKDPEQQQ